MNTYKFQPYRITKLDPVGNRRRDIECPKARSGHRIVADSGNIYSFGGYNPITEEETDDDDVIEYVLFKELWKYNLASKCWIKLNTSGKMPQELASHAASMVGDYLIIFGGTGVPFGMSSSNSVHICNLKTLQWSTVKAVGTAPLEQYGQAITVHKKKLYAVGGTTGFTYSMGVHCLDLETKEWKLLDTLLGTKGKVEPEPRYRHEIAIYGEQLFVFGGGTAFHSFGFTELPVFNLESKTWSNIPTCEGFPLPRRCHGCVQTGSDVYICGGVNGDSIFSDVWKIDLKTLKWTRLSITLTTPVYFHSTALSPEGQLFIFGGVTNIEQNTRTDELFSVWLKIPSLTEMSWQAILHYTPNIAETSREYLQELGVPLKYLNQIHCHCTDPDK